LLAGCVVAPPFGGVLDAPVRKFHVLVPAAPPV
jgi:hypothetical protein